MTAWCKVKPRQNVRTRFCTTVIHFMDPKLVNNLTDLCQLCLKNTNTVNKIIPWFSLWIIAFVYLQRLLRLRWSPKTNTFWMTTGIHATMHALKINAITAGLTSFG